MPAGRQIQPVGLVLPILDLCAVRSAGDKASIDRQVEAFVGGNVDDYRAFTWLRLEGAAEDLDQSAILRVPYPRGVVYRLDAPHVRISTRQARLPEDALDARVAGDGRDGRRRGEEECCFPADVHLIRRQDALAESPDARSVTVIV